MGSHHQCPFISSSLNFIPFFLTPAVLLLTHWAVLFDLLPYLIKPPTSHCPTHWKQFLDNWAVIDILARNLKVWKMLKENRQKIGQTEEKGDTVIKNKKS